MEGHSKPDLYLPGALKIKTIGELLLKKASPNFMALIHSLLLEIPKKYGGC
jgi:hypothetical protein